MPGLFASTQGAGFTYQGRLSSNGVPASGTYDFRFQLVSDSSGTNSSESAVTADDVAVTNGLFAVTLDFGSGVFDGSARWLIIGVRTNGAALDYTTLAPPQPLTPAPYALFAGSAAAAATATNLVAGGCVVGNGAGLTNLDGGTLQPGTVSWTALDATAQEQLIAQAGAAFDPTQPTNYNGSFTGSAFGLTNLNAEAAGLNVKAMGAVGDGVADDTAAIQAGLDSLGPQQTTLYFPPGTYRLTGTLTLPYQPDPLNGTLAIGAGPRLKGAGMSLTTLCWPGFAGIGIRTLLNGPNQGLRFEDFTLLGPLVDTWDATNNISIGLMLGQFAPGSDCYSGRNNRVQNCAFVGWAYGLAATNQYVLQVINCQSSSNLVESFRFVGSHNVNVANCWFAGRNGYAGGTGIAFHPPLNACLGDNATVASCYFSGLTNAIYNSELNLLCIDDHFEDNGYHILAELTGNFIVKGGYTLDNPADWNSGVPAQFSMWASHATQSSFDGMSIDATHRPAFNVVHDSSGFQLPSLCGQGSLAGLWNGTSNVTLYANASYSSVPTNHVGNTVRGQLPVLVNGVTYYIDLKK